MIDNPMHPTKRTVGSILSRLAVSAFLVSLIPSAFSAQYRFDSWTTENGLPQNSIWAIRQTRDGYLWMTTSSGLVRFDDYASASSTRGNTPGLTADGFAAYSLMEDRQGLWAATYTAGAVRNCHGVFRTMFMIGPDKKIKLMLTYPMSTGRNFDEVLRVLDSMQMTAKFGVSTPVNWKPGEDVVIPAALSNEEVAKKYPAGFKTVLPYLRLVAQPQ